MCQLKAYRISEYDWYAAYSADQAIELAMKDTGESKEDTVDDMYYTGEPESDDLEIFCDEGRTEKELITVTLGKMTEPGWCFGIEA